MWSAQRVSSCRHRHYVRARAKELLSWGCLPACLRLVSKMAGQEEILKGLTCPPEALGLSPKKLAPNPPFIDRGDRFPLPFISVP